MKINLVKVIAIICFLLLFTSTSVFAATEAISATGSNVTADITLESTGDEVTAVQQMLIALGYDPGPVDGYYGNATQTAIRQFQDANGLYPDGIVGSITRNALFNSASGQASFRTEPTESTLPMQPAESEQPAPSVESTLPMQPAESEQPAPSAESIPPIPPAESEELSLGSSGEDVLVIQQLLFALGYNPGNLDGYFGPVTEVAVKEFQAANCLYVDGIVGPITKNALFNAGSDQPVFPEEPEEPEEPEQPIPPAEPTQLSLGSNGEDVLATQLLLWTLGYNTGTPDGYFGPVTEAAVKEFQTANCLYVDGIVGPITNNALYSALSTSIPQDISASLQSLFEDIFTDEDRGASALNSTTLTFHEDGWYIARLEVELWDKETQQYEWIYSTSRAKGQKTTVTIDTDKYEINRVGYQIWFFGWDNDYMNLPWANTDYATDFTLSGSGDYPEFSWK